MFLATSIAAFLIGQSPVPAEAPATPSVAESAQRAAIAAERAADAAERSARAAEELARRAAPAPAAAPAAPAQPEPSKSSWSGTVGLGLIALSGNSETLTFNTTGVAEWRLPSWVLGTKVSGTYGQTRVDQAAEAKVVALAAAGQLRVDRKLTSIANAFVLAGVETDHVKSLELRTLGEGGAAIAWVERKEGNDTVLLVRTDLGVRYANESRFQYYPAAVNLEDVRFIAPKLGLGLRYALNKNVVFLEEADAATNVVGASRMILNSLSRINARLTEVLSFSVGFQVSHDSAPAAGKKPTDTILSAGIEASL